MQFSSTLIHLIGQKKTTQKNLETLFILHIICDLTEILEKNILKIKEEVFHLIMREKKEKITNILFNLFQRFLKKFTYLSGTEVE